MNHELNLIWMYSNSAIAEIEKGRLLEREC